MRTLTYFLLEVAFLLPFTIRVTSVAVLVCYYSTGFTTSTRFRSCVSCVSVFTVGSRRVHLFVFLEQNLCCVENRKLLQL